MRMMLLKAAVVAVVLAYLGARYHRLLDLGKRLPPSTQRCVLLDRVSGEGGTGSGGGQERLLPVEDLVLYRSGILLGGAGATIECMHHSPENAREGYMVVIDLRSGHPVVSRVEISGLLHTRFQPHGIFYSSSTERLYTVNHGGTTGVGSRVEMFDVTEGDDGLPRLQWRMAIGGGGIFPNVALNSVVEGISDEIYVTQFQNFAIPVGGEKHVNSIQERLGRLGQLALEFLALGGFTGVHRCTFDPISRTTTKCSQVASGFVHANGITINEARNKLWVSDPVRRRLSVFARDEGGTLTELPEESVELPHAVDNVHLDPVSGHLFTGSIPFLYEQLDHSHPRHGTFLEISTSDGVTFDSFTEVVVHDGTLLNQVSACYRVNTDDGSMWGICGSPLGDGLLACSLQEEGKF